MSKRKYAKLTVCGSKVFYNLFELTLHSYIEKFYKWWLDS